MHEHMADEYREEVRPPSDGWSSRRRRGAAHGEWHLALEHEADDAVANLIDGTLADAVEGLTGRHAADDGRAGVCGLERLDDALRLPMASHHQKHFPALCTPARAVGEDAPKNQTNNTRSCMMTGE